MLGAIGARIPCDWMPRPLLIDSLYQYIDTYRPIGQDAGMWAYRVIDGLWALLPVLLAVLAIRKVSVREQRRFSSRYGLEVTPETTPAITRSIRRGRAGRFTCAALGLSLYPVMYGIGLTIPNQSAYYGLGGYLLGAFLMALVPGLPPTENRRASLVPRRARDYLPRTALIMPVLAITVSTLAVIAYHFEPHRSFADFSGTANGLGLTTVAVIATFVAVRVVVARPQPLTTPGLVAVDDAVRTQAVHNLAGAGIAVALLGTSACLFEMGGYASPEWLHITGGVAGFGALTGTVAAWTFRGSPWRVQRALPQ